ncbi:MAG: hypothetical protein HKL90_14455 [Elusimicrobia bacterium]|nr:hypothetical protein [Elusimicrobiota bacterium]
MIVLGLMLALSRLASAQTAEQVWSGGTAAFDGAALRPAAPIPTARPDRAAAPAPQLTLSQLARDLQQDPGAVDDLMNGLAQAEGQLGQTAAASAQRAKLENALRRADPAVLDRFPILTIAETSAAVALYAGRQGVLPDPVLATQIVFSPAHAPEAPPKDADVTALGHGLLHGDDSLAVAGANWSDAKDVCAALDMLSMNDGTAPARVLIDGGRRYTDVRGWLGELTAEGHSIQISDRRFYANFGHLRYEKDGVRYDVTTPTRIDTGITLRDGRRVIVPVTHSEIDVAIRGPRVNAELSFYFGVDGGVGFRPFDTRDMDWVGGRTTRTWTGTDAARLLDRAGWIRRELMAKAKRFDLPMGGYGPLGDCNDADAILTGAAPFGMLREAKYFAGDSPIDAVSNSLPYDLTQKVALTRIWDSRPFENVADIPMPDVRATMDDVAAALGLKSDASIPTEPGRGAPTN